MSDGAVLLTPRTVLRRPRVSDLPAFHAILTDPQVMRYWSVPEHDSLDQSARWLNAMIDGAENDEFVIERDGQVIGKAGAWCLLEVGFLLHRDHWRQGLMTEVLLVLLPWLFARHPHDAITAEIDPRNIASRRVLERVGFRVTHSATRTLQWRDEWCDSLYLALPRPGAA